MVMTNLVGYNCRSRSLDFLLFFLVTVGILPNVLSAVSVHRERVNPMALRETLLQAGDLPHALASSAVNSDDYITTRAQLVQRYLRNYVRLLAQHGINSRSQMRKLVERYGYLLPSVLRENRAELFNLFNLMTINENDSARSLATTDHLAGNIYQTTESPLPQKTTASVAPTVSTTERSIHLKVSSPNADAAGYQSGHVVVYNAYNQPPVPARLVRPASEIEDPELDGLLHELLLAATAGVQLKSQSDDPLDQSKSRRSEDEAIMDVDGDGIVSMVDMDTKTSYIIYPNRKSHVSSQKNYVTVDSNSGGSATIGNTTSNKFKSINAKVDNFKWSHSNLVTVHDTGIKSTTSSKPLLLNPENIRENVLPPKRHFSIPNKQKLSARKKAKLRFASKDLPASDYQGKHATDKLSTSVGMTEESAFDELNNEFPFLNNDKRVEQDFGDSHSELKSKKLKPISKKHDSLQKIDSLNAPKYAVDDSYHHNGQSDRNEKIGNSSVSHSEEKSSTVLSPTDEPLISSGLRVFLEGYDADDIPSTTPVPEFTTGGTGFVIGSDLDANTERSNLLKTSSNLNGDISEKYPKDPWEMFSSLLRVNKPTITAAPRPDVPTPTTTENTGSSELKNPQRRVPSLADILLPLISTYHRFQKIRMKNRKASILDSSKQVLPSDSSDQIPPTSEDQRFTHPDHPMSTKLNSVQKTALPQRFESVGPIINPEQVQEKESLGRNFTVLKSEKSRFPMNVRRVKNPGMASVLKKRKFLDDQNHPELLHMNLHGNMNLRRNDMMDGIYSNSAVNRVGSVELYSVPEVLNGGFVGDADDDSREESHSDVLHDLQHQYHPVVIPQDMLSEVESSSLDGKYGGNDDKTSTTKSHDSTPDLSPVSDVKNEKQASVYANSELNVGPFTVDDNYVLSEMGVPKTNDVEEEKVNIVSPYYSPDDILAESIRRREMLDADTPYLHSADYRNVYYEDYYDDQELGAEEVSLYNLQEPSDYGDLQFSTNDNVELYADREMQPQNPVLFDGNIYPYEYGGKHDLPYMTMEYDSDPSPSDYATSVSALDSNDDETKSVNEDDKSYLMDSSETMQDFMRPDISSTPHPVFRLMFSSPVQSEFDINQPPTSNDYDDVITADEISDMKNEVLVSGSIPAGSHTAAAESLDVENGLESLGAIVSSIFPSLVAPDNLSIGSDALEKRTGLPPSDSDGTILRSKQPNDANSDSGKIDDSKYKTSGDVEKLPTKIMATHFPPTSKVSPEEKIALSSRPSITAEPKVLSNATTPPILPSSNRTSPDSPNVQKLSSDQLAYILVGVTCTLSLLCFLLVAITMKCRRRCSPFSIMTRIFRSDYIQGLGSRMSSERSHVSQHQTASLPVSAGKTGAGPQTHKLGAWFNGRSETLVSEKFRSTLALPVSSKNNGSKTRKPRPLGYSDQSGNGKDSRCSANQLLATLSGSSRSGSVADTSELEDTLERTSPAVVASSSNPEVSRERIGSVGKNGSWLQGSYVFGDSQRRARTPASDGPVQGVMYRRSSSEWLDQSLNDSQDLSRTNRTRSSLCSHIPNVETKSGTAVEDRVNRRRRRRSSSRSSTARTVVAEINDDSVAAVTRRPNDNSPHRQRTHSTSKFVSGSLNGNGSEIGGDITIDNSKGHRRTSARNRLSEGSRVSHPREHKQHRRGERSSNSSLGTRKEAQNSRDQGVSKSSGIISVAAAVSAFSNKLASQSVTASDAKNVPVSSEITLAAATAETSIVSQSDTAGVGLPSTASAGGQDLDERLI